MFLKALEEVYSVEPADRFMETGSIWQAIALDLCRNLEGHEQAFREVRS